VQLPFDTNLALNLFPFSGTIAVSQYLSVIPSQPFEASTMNFSFLSFSIFSYPYNFFLQADFPILPENPRAKYLFVFYK